MSKNNRFSSLIGSLIGYTAFWIVSGAAAAQSFKENMVPLIEASCISCHDGGTETRLNLEKLGQDFTDPDTFRKWEKVFDRVQAGEMPPAKEARPDAKQFETALGSLKKELLTASLARQTTVGRVPARRLTKLEFGYTIRDLLAIEADVTSGIPDEVDTGSFDTVGSTQRISAIHLASYLQAADEALDTAFNLGPKPYRTVTFDLLNNPFLNEFHDKPLNLGGNVTRKLDDGVALFRDVDYLLTSYAAGFNATTPGVYRITSKVAAFQSKEPVTLKLIRKEPSGGAKLLGSFDLEPGKTETIEVSAFLKPGDIFYTTFEMAGMEPIFAIAAAGGAKNYKGKGIALHSQCVEGPLTDSWPPKSTHQLLSGTNLLPDGKSAEGPFRVELSDKPIEHVATIVERIAPRAFRRPPVEGELAAFVHLAEPATKEGRDFVEALRAPLRAMLSSPQFVMFDGQAGKLDNYALANRLSYFLWKSLPDDDLFALAHEGMLSDPEVLRRQVDRMLADEKSNRFIRDFLGQWLRLSKVNATSPDEKLYPEYDELLGQAIPIEPELFFTELISKNLSIANLIDSDFTFLNRRLAEHYQIAGVEGQQFRKVALPKDCHRGGILTQAAILKTTANGTTTSPVMRGNFILTNLLGTPPAPPPPGAGSIEPDIRGKTTIREILAAHRSVETCAKCHREIDPPGFALESFDPIGGYRTKYRATTGGVATFGGGKIYKDGPHVDASGETADGKAFSGVEEFKQYLMGKKDMVAKQFLSRLVAYATGGEVQFADREELDDILDRTRKNDYPVRDIFHEVVQSKLFRNK